MFKSFDPRSHVALKPGATHALIKHIVQRDADNKTSTRRQKRAFPRGGWALRLFTPRFLRHLIDNLAGWPAVYS
jgi:hypothetical protein